MNLLVDELPKTVELNGRNYEIRSDFRISVLYEMLMEDMEVPPEEKYPAALALYFPEIPEDIEGAVDAMHWFYSGGREEPKAGNSRTRTEGETAGRIYSFAYDDQYIYAAFLSQYGIDLNSIPDLHWWKFIALFRSLDHKSLFSKIMGYRAMEIPKDMPQKQKEFYREMKELYRLPVSKAEQEEVNAIEDALINGGDLSGVLR